MLWEKEESNMLLWLSQIPMKNSSLKTLDTTTWGRQNLKCSIPRTCCDFPEVRQNLCFTTLIEPIELLLLKAFRAEMTGDRVENCDASSGVGETYFRSCWALSTHVSWWSYHTLQKHIQNLIQAISATRKFALITFTPYCSDFSFFVMNILILGTQNDHV